MDDGLRKNDPNKAIIESEKSGIRPGFLGGSGGGEAPAGSKAAERAQGAQEAKDNLQAAEQSAADEGGLYRPEDSLKGVRENEESASGFYSGAGKSIVGDKGKKKKKKGIKGILLRGGPFFIILLSVFGIGGIMGGTQLFQPFSLVAQFSETFNSMQVSANRRSNTFFRLQMNGQVKSPIGKKFMLFGEDTFKISKRQATKLANQGIEYDEDYEGKGVRVLKYEDDAGNLKIVTASPEAAAKIGNGAVEFNKIYADDLKFSTSYNNGSLTWRGAIANWFGTVTGKFFSNNNLTRNMWQDFQQKTESNGGDAKAAVQDTLLKRTDEIDGGGVESKRIDEEEEYESEDEEGNTKTGTRLVDIEEEDITLGEKDANGNIIKPGTPDNGSYVENGEGVKDSSSKASRTSMTENTVKAKLDDISGKVQKGANIACTVMNVIGAVSLLVTAAEAIQIINLTTAYFEASDKVKAEDGDDSPIHVLADALNEKKETKHEVLKYNGNGSDSEDNITADGVKALSTEETESVTKTAMQSAGIASLYGGPAVNPDDPSVQSFNFTGNIKRILGGIGVSMGAFETCAIAKIAANTATAIGDGVKVAGCILGLIGAAFTFGISTSACAGLITGVVKSIAFSVAIGVVVGAIIASITPIVAQSLTRDLVTDLGGEDLGNALTSGGNMYLGNAHRANGGSLSSKEKYTEFALAQQQVIAENARQERATLSPFDLTSKYTFMGTLMTQFMSFLTTTSLMNTIMTSSSVVSSSIASLSPTAMAYDVSETLPDMKEYEETCPYLASIGAVGDAFCNPYAITDVSTMEYNPSDVIDTLDGYGSFSGTKTVKGSDGEVENVVIDGNSDLAKYILFCDNRESAFGIADANIVSKVSDWGQVETGSSTFNNVVNSAIGAVPVLGDIIDVVSNQQALDNVGYVSGESCVAGNTVEAASSPDWSKAKYYQRFIEDQSLAESMGLVEESAVTAYLDEYYEENPLDNSYEGILARKSGLSKEQVVAILDLVDYAEYVAEYDPSTRYVAGGVILPQRIVYADVRNRSFAV